MLSLVQVMRDFSICPGLYIFLNLFLVITFSFIPISKLISTRTLSLSVERPLTRKGPVENYIFNTGTVGIRYNMINRFT